MSDNPASRNLSKELNAAISGIRRAFGAPGDHGYETREGKALYALYRAASVFAPGIDEIERLRAENLRLRIALHDAIHRPMGLVPASGEEFFDVGECQRAAERRPGVEGASTS